MLSVLCPVQVFSSHIMLFLLNIFVDPSFRVIEGQVQLNQISSSWLRRLHQLRVEMLLLVTSSALGIATKKSGISHPVSVRRVSAASLMGKGSIMRCYCGLVLCEDLRFGGSHFNMYGESIMPLN